MAKDKLVYGLRTSPVLKCAECERRPRVRPAYQDDLQWSQIPRGWLMRRDDFSEHYFLCPQCAAKLTKQG